MKELNDKDFDQTFKTRITEVLPEFEEESWLKMEMKLRKKNKLVFLRYASILLVFLSFGIGIYLWSKNNTSKVEMMVSKKVSAKESKNIGNEVKPYKIKVTQNNKLANSHPYQTPVIINQSFEIIPAYNAPVKNENFMPTKNVVVQNSANTKTQEVITITQQPVEQNLAANKNPITAQVETELAKPKNEVQTKVKRKIPISLAIVAGPDFSYTGALIGGKKGLSFGLTVGMELIKKLSVQTGISYGSKNYTTSAYNYTFSNPNANKANFSGIEAACEVIEIPLKVSYSISENEKRSIEINAGLSSYLMVKEKYVFKYNQALNRADRITDLANINQHYLSVVELSTTYNIKLKNKKFAFGIEPYVKIPLTGIGEGNVPLKSSGVFLKLRYDFNKN